jgi:hypothetical protein
LDFDIASAEYSYNLYKKETFDNPIDCSIVSEVPTNLVSGFSQTDDTDIATAVGLAGPQATSNVPGIGDIVVRIDNQDVSETMTLEITMGYHSV